jgi:hydroxypyruvate reductase
MPGISLADKQQLTRAMSERGATIGQMNAVRRALSRVKGGGLARECRAGRLVSLIISDVPGDDLATIGSGPTVLGQRPIDPAIEALESLCLSEIPAGKRALALLYGQQDHAAEVNLDPHWTPHGCHVSNVIIGNNATAVDAAGVEAERLGYSHAMVSSTAPEGLVGDVAEGLVAMAVQMRGSSGPDCLITGGEPTVQLAPADIRGHGGRNQQLCLAALARLNDWRGVALVSGGTDGEDGPTDAAGALVDQEIAEQTRRRGLDPREYLARNDAYSFFTQTGGLIRTGPTHTNVCDLRVLTVSR